MMSEYGAGLALGLANAVRHRIRGYRTPRPFTSDDLERNVEYAVGVGRRYQKLVSIRDKRILEIGPGPDLGVGATLLADGAASYQAVDMFPLADRDLTDFYAALQLRIGPIDQSRLRYTIATFPNLPELSGEFDLVISHATLEHIDDIPGLFRRARELAPAGAMCHFVDAMTHIGPIRDRDPLNILRFGDKVYSLMQFPGIPNRLRADDYVAAAVTAGFGDAHILPERETGNDYLSRVQSRLAPRFRNRADIRYLTFNLVTGLPRQLPLRGAEGGMRPPK
jgi:hypothetical protein